jgi:imidazolonepropionase-like amidohydrolase
MKRVMLAGAAVFVLATAGAAQVSVGRAGTYVIRGATIVTGAGQPIANGSVLIQDGKIAAVGASVTTPSGATEIDARGKFVYAGMIDSYTPIGLAEIESVQTTNWTGELGNYTPNLRAVVAINVESEMIGVTRVNGVTSAIVAPSANLLGGQPALINLDGYTWEQMTVKPSVGFVINYPRVPTFGGGFGGGQTNPELQRTQRERVNQQIAELRSTLSIARDYHRAREAGSTTIDVQHESLRPLFRGEVPAIVLANSAEDIRGAVALADSFGIRIVIQGGDDAWRVADLLKTKNVPVILGSLWSLPAADAPYDALYAQPGVLYEKGVKFAFSTGSASGARHLPYSASLAVGYGLPSDVAWKALTVWPAEIWGVADRLGTIEVGKIANLFVTSGDALDPRSQVSEVFIAGKRVPFDDRHDQLYQKYNARH